MITRECGRKWPRQAVFDNARDGQRMADRLCEVRLDRAGDGILRQVQWRELRLGRDPLVARSLPRASWVSVGVVHRLTLARSG